MLPHTRKHATEQRAAATIVDGMNLLITAAGSPSACVLFRSASQRPVTQFRDGAWYRGVPSEKCTKHLVPCHLVLCNRVQTGQMRLVICKEWIHICKNNVIKHQNTRYQALEHTCCQAPESMLGVCSERERKTCDHLMKDKLSRTE